MWCACVCKREHKCVSGALVRAWYPTRENLSTFLYNSSYRAHNNVSCISENLIMTDTCALHVHVLHVHTTCANIHVSASFETES